MPELRSATQQTVSSGGFEITLSVADGVGLPSRKGIVCGDAFGKDLDRQLAASGSLDLILDIGTGAGHLAIIAGLKGVKKVIATDVVDAYLDAVKKNWELNGLDPARLTVIKCGDINLLPEEYLGKADAVISNPPQMPTILSEKVDTSDEALFFTGLHPNGRELIDQIVTGAQPLLKEKGSLYCYGVSYNSWKTTQDLLCAHWGEQGKAWTVLSTMTNSLNNMLDHSVFMKRVAEQADVLEWFQNQSTPADQFVIEREGEWFLDSHLFKATKMCSPGKERASKRLKSSDHLKNKNV